MNATICYNLSLSLSIHVYIYICIGICICICVCIYIYIYIPRFLQGTDARREAGVLGERGVGDRRRDTTKSSYAYTYTNT